MLRDLRDYLLGVRAVADLVGDRIYESALRQGCSMPAVVLTAFGGDGAACLTGRSAGVATTRVQVDTFADDPTTAHELGERIRRQASSGAALQGYRGTMGASRVLSCECAGTPRRGVDVAGDRSDQRRHWASRDYLITHSEDT